MSHPGLGMDGRPLFPLFSLHEDASPLETRS
jgi:hypothetical protein